MAADGRRTRLAGTNEVEAMSDWTSFGRVDDDGTVYVKTSAGERVVGSWQAGTPEEGLAHFARRFADIVTEVDLIEARLASGAADPATRSPRCGASGPPSTTLTWSATSTAWPSGSTG
jgi:hypothetical protein